MKTKKLWAGIAVTLAVSMALSACSAGGTTSGSSAASNTASTATNGTKKTFTIYNAAGAPGYHEQVVLKKFKEKFGTKYNVQYETMTGTDAITKIESQGLKKGSGNINIVMIDKGLSEGLEAGVFADLSGEESKLRVSDFTAPAKAMYEANDKSAIPIAIEPSQPSITYMPATAVGKRLDKVVGTDGGISYTELKNFIMTDSGKPKMGTGRFSTSGPGDLFDYGLMLLKDQYGKDVVPQKSIDFMKDIYTSGQLSLYNSTSATFKDMVSGNVDIVPNSLSWFYRLYALKKEESTLSQDLKVDSLGLDKAKFAFMTDDSGKPVQTILTAHYYAIPSNLSDEDYASSMEFLNWVTQPEMNAEVLTILYAPTYKSATPDLIKDESVKTVWKAVEKYYPQQFLEQSKGSKVIKTTDRKFVINVTDVGITKTYVTAWQDQLESKANKK